MVAFYFPGRCAPCDLLCGAPFLGNFHKGELKLRELVFQTAEGAFQATKFWDEAHLFQDLDGQGAFDKARLLSMRRTPDSNAAGFASKLCAMEAVISSKFKEGSPLAAKLCSTKDCFLLLGLGWPSYCHFRFLSSLLHCGVTPTLQSQAQAEAGELQQPWSRRLLVGQWQR